MSQRRQVLLALAFLATAHGSVGRAVPSTPLDRFDAMLMAIDLVPPDRASLEAEFPDAWQRLDRVAREPGRETWSRIRAVNLLSYFPEARTRATLEVLSADLDKAIRRQAIYTLGRGFMASADAALVCFIEAHAADREIEVAEHAVRALRWVDHPEAKLALERLAGKGGASLRRLAQTTLAKRTQRLAAPPRGH